MTGNILVTPEKLISTAQEFSSLGQTVNGLTQKMVDTVTSLSTTWSGEAHTAYLNKFNQLNDDMQKIYTMIQEHSNDLQEMAKNYSTAEATNVDSGNSLNADVIS